MTPEQKKILLAQELLNLEAQVYKTTTFATALRTCGLNERAEQIAKEAAQAVQLVEFYKAEIAKLDT